jgi:hypothetical protein
LAPPYLQSASSDSADHINPLAHDHGDLLYVAPSDAPDLVTYYTYPASKLVATLNATARGLCSDSQGNIFIVNSSSITEFAHGGTSPINTIHNLSYNYFSCSVDPTTGNLAVTLQDSYGHAGIGVFKNATGTQITYADSDFSKFDYCGYDGSGNLFADGYTGRAPAAFAELGVGQSALKTVTLNRDIRRPGQVQWDGENMTIADEQAHKLYRVSINTSAATVTGTTKIDGFPNVFSGSWIYGGMLIAPFSRKHRGYIGFWKYPEGGSPTKTLGIIYLTKLALPGKVGAWASLTSRVLSSKPSVTLPISK